jgi:hypothetical protein
MRRKIYWTDGQADRGKTVYSSPPSGSVGIHISLVKIYENERINTVVLGYPPVGSLCLSSQQRWNIKQLLSCHDGFWYMTVWQNSNYFQSDLNLSFLPNVDRKYYQCIHKIRGSRSDFKTEMYYWFIQRRGGTIASLFFCQKTVFLYFGNIISPSQRTSRYRNLATSPLTAKLSCCLTRCTFVFYAK